jgi:cysteine-rich repeat protein
MNRLRQIATLALALAVSLPALAQDTLSYQGSILNAARQPVTASYPIVFSLYTEREAGEVIWTESYDSIDIVDGTFNMDLGSVTPFPSRLGETAELYLGIAVNDGPEMMPRVKISSTLRARWAAHAKDVRGEDIHPNSVSINETEVINSQGQWVGDRAGLQGSQGAVGSSGVGVSGAQVDERGHLLFTLSSGEIIDSGSVRSSRSCEVESVTVDDAIVEDVVRLMCHGQEPVLLRTVYCGDGVVDFIEQCDDGNEDDTDTCTNACQTALCGDGIVHAGAEECDDGNVQGSDGCTSDCILERCGDGVVQGAEVCDDGNQNNLDGCRNDCQKPVCDGDVVSAGDDCDDGVSCTIDDCDVNLGCTNTVKHSLCNDTNVCTVGECDAQAGCINTNADGRPCSDGNPSTVGDSCVRGACVSGHFLP